MNKKISVLVVDDSALMRKKITEMINSSSDCEVVATAKDGFAALELLEKISPQVITLDLQLPNMDGLTCLEYIMKVKPTAVIVLSAFTKEGSTLAIRAFEEGAFDIIAKPGGVISPDIVTLTQDLLNKIRLATKAPIEKLLLCSNNKGLKRKFANSTQRLRKVVAIGASTGGPSTVYSLFEALPKDLPASILLIQHMPEYFIQSFAKRLDCRIDLEVKMAESGDFLLPGTVYVAPAGFDMNFSLSDETQEAQIQLAIQSASSPSIDAAFMAAATQFQQQLLGVVLTGMGHDGTQGCLAIKEHGGKTIAQDEESSIVFGMPKSAIEAHSIDKILPLNQIADAIIEEVIHDQ